MTLEIKTERDLITERLGLDSDKYSLLMPEGRDDTKQWVSVESLEQWLEDNEEFIYTRADGDLSEEHRRMIWKTKFLEELRERENVKRT